MNLWLSFSDASKFADIARNIVLGKGFVSNFNFFDYSTLYTTGDKLFAASFTPPAMPWAITVFFKIFGINDTSVILTSTFFFLLTGIFTYFLANKLYGKTVGVLAALTVLINQSFWDYARTGASETLFMFEIVLIPYLLLFKKRITDILALIVLILMYFTRPQAFIFMAAYLVFWLLLNFKPKKVFIAITAITLTVLIFDYFFLLPRNGQAHVYSLIGRGMHAIRQHTASAAVSDVIRGLGTQETGIFTIVKKTGNNLFNFYRMLPQILSPYLFAFFILSLLFWQKKGHENAFKIVTVLAVIGSFLLPALTIPFFRYIHPVLPLIYILAIGMLVKIVRILTHTKEFQLINLPQRAFVPLSGTALILFFTVMSTIISGFQDYRYFRARSNPQQPPVYVCLSQVLKDNTGPQSFIITNLDTWGSWYGERKTMWFPLKPDQLIPQEENTIPFDAIFLTSYKMNDENHYMGEEWRQIFNNPENPQNEFIRENFQLKGIYTIPAEENNENYEAKAVLFLKK